MSDVVASPAAAAVGNPCPVCGREWGPGVACQSCNSVGGLPPEIRLASAGRRLGGYALDGLLVFVTLFFGWLIWSIVIWGRGQTPGMQILDMRVIKLSDRQAALRGKMFLREFIYKTVVSIPAWFTGFGFILYFWLLWDKNRQELWDKMADTIVVNDPQKLLDPGLQPAAIAAQPTAPSQPAAAVPEESTTTEGSISS